MNIFSKITYIRILLFCGILFCFSLSSFSQNEVESPTPQTQTMDTTHLKQLQQFVRNIATFNYLFPQEKVYLHFDNTSYYLGETMWFKAYVVNSTTNRPTHLSRVLHVELLSPEGRIMETQKLKIENGQCAGQFTLTHLIHAGFYEVRAYTRSMLNWDTECIFSRIFPFYNYPQKEGVGMYDNPQMHLLTSTQALPYKRPKAKKREKINLSFYPEGGHLVDGLTSNVAFQITDEQGNPINDIKGYLYNNKNELITGVQVMHNGMGRFPIKPIKGETYQIEIEKDSKKKIFELPKSIQEGYVMNINALRKDAIFIQLSRSESTDSSLPLAICGMCRGNITYFTPITWNNSNLSTIIIDKNSLPAGVNQFVLFDNQGKIYSERMFFIMPQKQINVNYTSNINELKGKDAIKINFQLTDYKQKPLETTFSVSIRDLDTDAPSTHASDMQKNLLLESDLKGYISDIDYYFEADDQVHRMALDLLMSVQGWSRYDWQQMANPKNFIINHPVEEGITIMGQLRSTFRKKIKKNTEIKVWIIDEGGTYQNQKGSCFTDSLGKFAFVAEDFEGRWKMFIHTKENDKRKEMRVDLDRNFSPSARFIQPKEKELFTHQTKQIADSSIFIGTQEEALANTDEKKRSWENLLPTIDINAKNLWETKEMMRWHNIIIDMNDERERMNDTGEEYLKYFYEYLEETNPYFSYTPDTVGNIKATYKNRPVIFATHRSGAPTWLNANGDISITIDNLSMNDLDAIAISDKPGVATALFRDSVENERSVVISLFIKESYFSVGHDDRKGERKTLIKGFSPTRQFYMPDYSMAELPDEKDYRRTLYWNPYVQTDAQGEANIEFYNTETCRKMKISLTTLTPQGVFGGMEE